MKLFWRRHDNESVRIWRDDWAGDQFDVIPNDELGVLERYAQHGLALPIEEADDD